ncbi:MAG: hypothetical protein KBT20_01210 [Bacteroidales bacterium]|nr:hypothetical protein [Candidatus Liminaster caballi]
MRKLLTLIFATFMVAAFAQEIKKPVCTIYQFSGSREFSHDEVTIVRNNIVSSLQKTHRLEIVDLSNTVFIEQEAERRMQESAMNDMRMVNEITTLMSNYAVTGNLDAITVENVELKDYKTGRMYTAKKATMTYSIKIFDPSTGSIVSSRTYSSSSTENTADVARKNAVSGSSRNMKALIEECFPVKGMVLTVADKDKKGKAAKTVYINLGSEFGIEKGQLFDVKAIIDIAGEKAEKSIGSLKAVEVMSATRTLCEVKAGGEDILKHIEAGNQLPIQTRDTNNALSKFWRDL